MEEYSICKDRAQEIETLAKRNQTDGEPHPVSLITMYTPKGLNVTEEETVELVAEEKTEEERKDKKIPELVNENPWSESSECVGAEGTLDTTKNNTTLPISFKGFDLSAKSKQIFSKLVSRTKKPKKEALEVINSILDDIFREVEGEELDLEEKKGEVEEKKEEQNKESDKKVIDEEKQEETGVLDKSND